MTRFDAGSATDVGRVRSNNQDSLHIRDGELFAVADGMGGHQGGEVASALALSILNDTYGDRSTATLVEAVRSANQAVYEKAGSDPDLTGMGTTLTALADVDTSDGKRLAIVNVGDSRLYRLHDGELAQVTDDHSLVASLVRQGRITAEEAESHPQRNILTRALGIDAAVAVDSWEIEPVVGDRFLICSDGLFNEVDQNRMVATLRRLSDPTDAARELVRLANEGGGRDNITAVVVDVVGLDGSVAVDSDDDDPSPTLTTAPHAAVGSSVFDGDGDRGDVGRRSTESDRDDEPRSRRFTWRVAVFVLALLLLVGVVVGALGWYARNTYFVTLDEEQVVIFKGRPGGFLWFDPTVEVRTDIAAADVPDAELADIENGVDQATLGDAERYVENLRGQIDQLTTGDDRPTTTTTTVVEDEPGGAGGANEGGNSGTKPAGNN